MSNRYYDSYIYAIDNEGCKYLVAYFYHGHLGDGYRNEVIIANNHYSISSGIFDDDDEVVGQYLPEASLNDCRSYFSKKPTAIIQQTIKAAGLEKVEINKLIWFNFGCTYSNCFEKEGIIISSGAEICVEEQVFENAMIMFNPDDLNSVVHEMLKKIA